MRPDRVVRIRALDTPCSILSLTSVTHDVVDFGPLVLAEAHMIIQSSALTVSHTISKSPGGVYRCKVRVRSARLQVRVIAQAACAPLRQQRAESTKSLGNGHPAFVFHYDRPVSDQVEAERLRGDLGTGRQNTMMSIAKRMTTRGTREWG